MTSLTDLSLKYGISRFTLRSRIKKHSIVPFYYKHNNYLSVTQEKEICYNINFKKTIVIFQSKKYITLESKMNYE